MTTDFTKTTWIDRVAADLRCRVREALPEGWDVEFQQPCVGDSGEMFQPCFENGHVVDMIETTVRIRIPLNIVRQVVDG